MMALMLPLYLLLLCKCVVKILWPPSVPKAGRHNSQWEKILYEVELIPAHVFTKHLNQSPLQVLVKVIIFQMHLSLKPHVVLMFTFYSIS